MKLILKLKFILSIKLFKWNTEKQISTGIILKCYNYNSEKKFATKIYSI